MYIYIYKYILSYIHYTPPPHHTPTTPQGVEGGTVLWLTHDHGRGVGTLDHICIFIYIYRITYIYNGIWYGFNIDGFIQYLGLSEHGVAMNPNMMINQSWPQTPTRQAFPWRHMHFSLKVPWFQDSQREACLQIPNPFPIMSPGHTT